MNHAYSHVVHKLNYRSNLLILYQISFLSRLEAGKHKLVIVSSDNDHSKVHPYQIKMCYSFIQH